MIYLILIVILVILLISVITLIVMLIKGSNDTNYNVYIEGGYNTETGLKENLSGKIFVGMSQNSRETCLINSECSRNIIICDISRNIKYQYVNQKSVYIGRDINKKNERNFLYVADDNTISKMHCMVETDGKTIKIQDLNSSNHTYVNGVEIDSPVKISENDVIKVGRRKFVVKIE